MHNYRGIKPSDASHQSLHASDRHFSFASNQHVSGNLASYLGHNSVSDDEEDGEMAEDFGEQNE